MTSEQVRELLFSKPSCDLDAYKIGDSLSWVWKDFQTQNPDRACIRLCTMNLLVVCSTPADAEGLAAELQEVAQLYPGRIIAVVLDPDHQGGLQGWYRIENIAGHPEQLGCEMVGLHSGPDGQPLPSLLAPLWNGGVSLFLWWRGRAPYQATWFNHLCETAQRIILDTGSFGGRPRALGQPPEAVEPLARVADMVEDRYHQELAFTDLNWGRLRTWRELVASLFDAEERRVLLAGLQQIEIVTWAPQRDITPSLQGLYIAGWLARQLGYKVERALEASPEGDSHVAIMRHSNGAEARLILKYQPTQDIELEARITRVILSGEMQGQPFRLAVEREDADSSTLLRSGSLRRPMLCNAMQMRRLSSRQLLGTEFETFGRDSVFEGSLRKALELAGATALAAR